MLDASAAAQAEIPGVTLGARPLQLRRYLGDMAAVLALPAMWRRSTTEQVVTGLPEVLRSLLRLDAVYVRYADTRNWVECVAPAPLDAAALREALEGQPTTAASTFRLPDVPALRLARFVSGVDPTHWLVGALSHRPDFPTGEERFLATVTLDQAAMVVEQKRLLADANEARREAEIANAAKMEFLAAMSHEVRTPINAIAGYTDLLELGVHGAVTPAQAEDLRRMKRNQQYLLGLVNDILHFARLEAGQVQLDITRVGLDAVLLDLELSIRPQAHAKGLRYEYVRCDPSLRVLADAEKLAQIVLNLLTNAVKFSGAGGSVTVTCSADDARVAIHVADTGPGIPADKLSAIFDPFVQVQRRGQASEGVGLGLAISRGLARAMAGDLVAESVLGHGSVFTLLLPRADTPAHN